jgi:hypothetical protein
MLTPPPSNRTEHPGWSLLSFRIRLWRGAGALRWWNPSMSSCFVRDGTRGEKVCACQTRHHPHSPLHFLEADPLSRFLLLPPLQLFLTVLLHIIISARIRGLCEVVLQLLLSSKCLPAGPGMAHADRGVARGHQRACPVDLSPRRHFAACRPQGRNLLPSHFQGISHMLPCHCSFILSSLPWYRPVPSDRVPRHSTPPLTTVTRRQDESRRVIAVLCFLAPSITPIRKG